MVVLFWILSVTGAFWLGMFMATHPSLAYHYRHRCGGCGLRWTGIDKGQQLCGDCWRIAQPHVHMLRLTVPAPRTPA